MCTFGNILNSGDGINIDKKEAIKYLNNGQSNGGEDLMQIKKELKKAFIKLITVSLLLVFFLWYKDDIIYFLMWDKSSFYNLVTNW